MSQGCYLICNLWSTRVLGNDEIRDLGSVFAGCLALRDFQPTLKIHKLDGMKLLYAGFETCFGPSAQGAGTRYQNTSRFQISRHFEFIPTRNAVNKRIVID